MFVPPIIERELRIALRNREAVKSRFRYALGGAGVVCVFLFFGWLAGSRSWGNTLHQILFFGGLYLAVIPPAHVSVGLFCEERRNQTLELLYLAGLGSGELFFGKLLGGVLIASGDLLALTPFLAVPFLSGGVSLDLFLATIACFPVVLFFTVSIGVLASVMCRDDGAALVCAVILGGVICLAVPLPYYLGTTVAGAPPFSAGWLCLSPAFAPYLVWMNFAGGTPHLFWKTAGVTALWAFACLSLAAILLSRNWRQEIVRSAPEGWQGKWAAWLHGSPNWRRALRKQVLPVNAFQWLAQQDRRAVLLAWALMGGIVALWLAGWAAWPRVWPSPVNLYITAFLLLTGTGLIMIYAAALRIGIERREGSLELLLTTPLTPKELVEGQLAAVRAQFRPVRLGLLGLCGLMMLGGFLTRSWTVQAAISYLLIWCFFLGWCLHQHTGKVPLAMWIALNTGRPTAAVFLSQRFDPQRGGWRRFYWWFYMAMNFRNLWRGLRWAGGFPSGSTAELVVVSAVSGATLLFLALKHFQQPAPAMSQRLANEMRLIAREPLPDPKDPRYKKWNISERMPMSAYVKSYPERKQQQWGQRVGGQVGRQLGRGWGHWVRRRRS
jgi:hypothetical protein